MNPRRRQIRSWIWPSLLEAAAPALGILAIVAPSPLGAQPRPWLQSGPRPPAVVAPAPPEAVLIAHRKEPSRVAPSWTQDKIPPPDIFAISAASIAIVHVQPQLESPRALLVPGPPAIPFVALPAIGAAVVVPPGIPARRPDGWLHGRVPPPDVFAISASSIAVVHIQILRESPRAVATAGVPAAEPAPAIGTVLVVPPGVPVRRPDGWLLDKVPPIFAIAIISAAAGDPPTRATLNASTTRATLNASTTEGD